MTPKYKEGEELYYVNPFAFTIEKVKIGFIDIEEVNGELHYIDFTGAYLKEWDLVKKLPDAKKRAMEYLKRFYRSKEHEIKNTNPDVNLGEF